MRTIKPVFLTILCIISTLLQSPEKAIAQTTPAFTRDNGYCLYNSKAETCITAGGEENGIPRQIHLNVRLPIPFPQLWDIRPRDNETYVFKSRTNGLCIDIDNNKVVHKTESGEKSQEWIIESMDKGAFRIIWAKNKSLCLDINPDIDPRSNRCLYEY